jgi:hypothetical protein
LRRIGKMGAVQVATSVTALTTGQRGHMAMSFDSMDGSSAPTVLAGSCLEVAGALFQWTTDETPTASTWASIATASTVYMQCTPSGSAGTQILTTSYTTTVPTWVASKAGWYASAGSNVRVMAQLLKGGATAYNHKAMLAPQPVRKQIGGALKTLSATGLTILDDDGIETVVLSSTALTGTVTTTLCTAADNVGRRLRFRTENAHGTYEWVIDGEGAETINGYADWRMNGIYQRVDLISDGTGWIVESALGTLRTTTSIADLTASLASNVWGNPGSLSITLEPGIWEGEFAVLVDLTPSATFGHLRASLSTATNSESHPEHTAVSVTGVSSALVESLRFMATRRCILTVAAATTYYLIAKHNSVGTLTITFTGLAASYGATTVIRFRRVG